MDYKSSDIPRDTQSQDHNRIDAPTGNIYEAVNIIAKRADQLGDDLKMDLHEKLEEFATQNESLEEIFENKEQIEVSRFYESLAKPSAAALHEWLNGEIYFRRPKDASSEEA